MKKEEIEMNKNVEFGATINRIRQERNLTQKDLAKIIGVTDRTISKWEKGTTVPDLYQLRNICNELDISPSLLLKSESIFKDDVKSFKRKLGKVLNYVIHNIFLLGFIIVFLLLLIYFLNNYNSIKIYSLKYNSDNIYFNHGYLFKTKVANIITIENISFKKIKYTPSEISLELYTLSNGDKKVLYESDNLDNIYIEETIQNSDLLTKDILDNMKRNLHLYITTKDEDGNSYEYDCEIIFKEKFINNKLIYSSYIKNSINETMNLPTANVPLAANTDNEVLVSKLNNDNIYERLGFTYDADKDVYVRRDANGGMFEYYYNIGNLEYTITENGVKRKYISRLDKFIIILFDEENSLKGRIAFNNMEEELNNSNKYYKIYKDEIDYILSVYADLNPNVENGE